MPTQYVRIHRSLFFLLCCWLVFSLGLLVWLANGFQLDFLSRVVGCGVFQVFTLAIISGKVCVAISCANPKKQTLNFCWHLVGVIQKVEINVW